MFFKCLLDIHNQHPKLSYISVFVGSWGEVKKKNRPKN